MSSRYKSWTDVAALHEHLTVFLKLDEALERFLGDFAPFSRGPYKVRTDSGTLERSSRAEISDAVDSHGGSLDVLEVWYVGPGCRVNLDVRPFADHPLYRIGCLLHVSGDDEQQNNGRFYSLQNRMDAEIKRQWPKPKAVEQVTAPPSPPAATPPTANAPDTGGFKQWVNRVLRHPTGAQIVGALVVAGLIALIGVLAKAFSG